MAVANTFSGGTLDRAGTLRQDARWVAARLADPSSRALAVTREAVVVQDGEGDGVRLARVQLDQEPHDAEEVILLGLESDGSALFALDVEHVHAPAPTGTHLMALREAGARLPLQESGLAAYAVALVGWHRRHPHCAVCGALTDSAEAGHLRRCPHCHAEHHPRTDPVVIMLVTDGDRVLLGRQPSWPAGRYSALAGFVEPGEGLEEAVAREVREEASVGVADVRYVSSQPWPFPSSLMLGFEATYAGGEPQVGDQELEDVRWFTREELREAAAREEQAGPRASAWDPAPGGALALPPQLAIARQLIDGWLARGG
jgi:NAD+ diphosphatase